jgi:hypothetical protein
LRPVAGTRHVKKFLEHATLLRAATEQLFGAARVRDASAAAGLQNQTNPTNGALSMS